MSKIRNGGGPMSTSSTTTRDRTLQDRPRPSCCRTVGPCFHTHRTLQTWPLRISTFSPTSNATWTAKTSKLATTSRRHSRTSSMPSPRPSGARASTICLTGGRRSSMKMEHISSEVVVKKLYDEEETCQFVRIISTQPNN